MTVTSVAIRDNQNLGAKPKPAQVTSAQQLRADGFGYPPIDEEPWPDSRSPQTSRSVSRKRLSSSGFAKTSYAFNCAPIVLLAKPDALMATTGMSCNTGSASCSARKSQPSI